MANARLILIPIALPLLLAIGCSCDGDGDGDADTDTDTDGDRDRCLEGDVAADEIVPEELASGFSGDALRLATDWTTAVVCGSGFAVAVDLGSGAVGASASIPNPCTGVAVDGDLAAVVDALGTLVLFEVQGDAGLRELDRDENVAASYSGVLVSGGTVYVAAGAFGVLRFETTGDVLGALSAWTSATDARAIVPDGTDFAVGDGTDGVAILDDAGALVVRVELPELVQNVQGPTGLEEVRLPYEAESLAISDEWVVVGSGAYGYEWATRDGNAFGEVLLNGRPYFHEGPVFDVAIHGSEIVYVEGASIRRMGLAGDGALTRLASEYRREPRSLDGGWWIGLEAGDGEALLLATDGLYRTDLPAHEATPDIDVERLTIFADLEAGAEGPFLQPLRNYGDADLFVWLESVEPDVFTASFLDLAGIDQPDPDNPLCLRLRPTGIGETPPVGGSVEVVFAAGDGSPVEGLLTLATNDPDESTFTVDIQGNPELLDVGDAAPDFALTSLGGGVFRRSDLDGDVVLLMFYNST